MTVAKFRTNGEPMRSKVEGMTVFNTDPCRQHKTKDVLWTPLGVQRYDKFKYPVFDKLTQHN